MNSYLVKTSNNSGLGTDTLRIVKADSVKEAIIKMIEQIEDLKEAGTNILFDVTLMEVVE